MKKKSLLLLSFLLLLLVPVVPANAAYGDESPQSITSFSETLEDDVLFYPDSFGDFLADSGNATAVSGGTYASTHVSDGTNWYVAANINGITYNATFVLEFETDLTPVTPQIDVNIEYFFERSSGTGTFDDGGVQLYNHSSGTWDYIYQDVDWHGSEVTRSLSADSFGCIRADGVLNLRVTLEFTDSGSGTDFGLYIDFVQVSYMTLTDSNHYAESFTSVSDWSGYSTEAGDSISSDGDVGVFKFHDDDNSDYWQTNLSLGVITGYYIEFRIKYNVSGSLTSWNILKNGLLGAGGSVSQTGTIGGGLADTWYTRKALVTSTDSITGFAMYFSDPNYDYSLSVDYLRISPANETGWQHDGSTTAGFTDLVKMTTSTDNDKITLTATAAGNGEAKLRPDTTSTQAQIDPDYYPFLELSITAQTAPWYLEVFWSDASSDILHAYYADSGIFRYNIEAVSGGNVDLDYIAIEVLYYGGKTLTIDYIKLYSIANFTYSDSGVSTDDILYMDSDILYCSGTNFTSIILDYDPTLSIDSDIYTVWNVSTSSGTPQFDHYVGAWQGYSSETRGSLAGTTTDIRIKFTASANIAAIKFIDTHDWQNAGEAIIYFNVLFDYWALNMSLIFGGLIIMLVSVCILAKKVRDRNITNDAGILLLFLFCVGWGLFIGGTLIG